MYAVGEVYIHFGKEKDTKGGNPVEEKNLEE